MATTACGADGAAAGDASAVGAGQFTLAPSSHEGNAIGQFRVPPSAQPGTYEIVARRSGQPEVRGDLVVTLTGSGPRIPGGV
ncbi:Sortase OS=Streptomyces violarus OX=67380 GN=FHS41_003417 PE=4 SV=1 [Streptomyces violarus]